MNWCQAKQQFCPWVAEDGLCDRVAQGKGCVLKGFDWAEGTSDLVDKYYQDQEAKADAGKPKLSLVPTQVIRDIAEVREYGNRKYGDPENWRQVEAGRYIDALYRHLLAMVDDPTSVDSESGIAHYKHVACNIAFLCELLK